MKKIKDFHRKEQADNLQQLIEQAALALKIQEKNLDVNGKLITLKPEGKLIVIGDLHGDINTLKTLFQQTSFIKKIRNEHPIYLVCLGDYVDRGPAQVEVLSSLLRLLIEFPNNVILLRGNHEGPPDVKFYPHDFPLHLGKLFKEEGAALYDSFLNLFQEMFIAVLVKEKALLLHGCIPSKAESLEDIANPHKEDLVELLWNDPSPIRGIQESFRGIGKRIGLDYVNNFLEKVNVKVLIRGHQSQNLGYHVERGVVTLFSCKLPVYGNIAAGFLEANMDCGLSPTRIRTSIKLL